MICTSCIITSHISLLLDLKTYNTCTIGVISIHRRFYQRPVGTKGHKYGIAVGETNTHPIWITERKLLIYTVFIILL